MTLIFVDVEAAGSSPATGQLTEFGAVAYDTLETFHGILAEAEPSPENPAVPVITGAIFDPLPIMQTFADWLKAVTKGRPVFVSDNPAYDFMWIACWFDKTLGHNPFGHSARRIGDFYAGTKGDFFHRQDWKRLRKTKHDHNPVNDAMGNVEAFQQIMEGLRARE
jgi:hypothetical protein